MGIHLFCQYNSFHTYRLFFQSQWGAGGVTPPHHVLGHYIMPTKAGIQGLV